MASWSEVFVSRETRRRLEVHEVLLRKWNPRINLVSTRSLEDYWTRHAADSLQLLDHCHVTSGEWVDLGTGGGFPGVIVAIAAQTRMPDLRVHLVESDKRKAAFLTEVVRETGVAARVSPARVEQLPPANASIVSARALAPLQQLLGYANRHLAPGGRALFLKGANCDAEIAAALEQWSFDVQKIKSATREDAVILSIGDLSRA